MLVGSLVFSLLFEPLPQQGVIGEEAGEAHPRAEIKEKPNVVIHDQELAIFQRVRKGAFLVNLYIGWAFGFICLILEVYLNFFVVVFFCIQAFYSLVFVHVSPHLIEQVKSLLPVFHVELVVVLNNLVFQVRTYFVFVSPSEHDFFVKITQDLDILIQRVVLFSVNLNVRQKFNSKKWIFFIFKNADKTNILSILANC